MSTSPAHRNDEIEYPTAEELGYPNSEVGIKHDDENDVTIFHQTLNDDTEECIAIEDGGLIFPLSDWR